MKKHNLLKVILLVLLLVVIGSWFLPVYVASSGEFTIQQSIKIGLFNLATYVGIAIQVFGPTILYVLAVGGFYGVLYRIPQYRLLLDKIVDGFKGREWLFMTIVGVVLALLSSMAGLSVMIIILFPFIISVMLLMGYDKITIAMLTVGSVIAGLIGTVFSSAMVEGITAVLYESMSEEAMNIAKTDVIWKIALLVVSLALVLINTFNYAKKHRENEVDLEKSRLVPKKVKTDNKKIYPLVIVFDILLIVLTLGYISWDLLNVDLFTKMTDGFTNPTGTTFVRGLYGALNTVLGVGVNSSMNVNNTFGAWATSNGYEAALVVFMASALISFLYRGSFNSFVNSTGEGIKRALRPALLVVISYIILICAVTVPFEFSFLRHIIDLEGGFSLVVMCIVAFVFSVLTVEPYYGPVTAVSYISSSAVIAGNTGIIALVWQTMYGLSMLIAPTSLVLLVTLSYLDISYSSWIKAVWKLFLELFAVILIILLIFNR